jgi:hypothetical protein
MLSADPIPVSNFDPLTGVSCLSRVLSYPLEPVPKALLADKKAV